jgi:hypothetical protein
MVLMLARSEPLGPESEPLRLLLTSRLRELPFYLLAVAAAELVERLRRDEVRHGSMLGLHVIAAFAIVWLNAVADPFINRLVGPDLFMESATPLFAMRVFLVYGATVAFARAHMLTHWAAARSGVVREVTEALREAERTVCRAQVHQPAVLSSLRALEESCDAGAAAVDARAQSLARLLRLSLDALDAPDHDVEAELRIAEAYCAVFGVDGIASDITDDVTLHAIVPPGTLATAIASLGARPVERPVVSGGSGAARLELSVGFRTAGVVSELAALQRTLNGAVRGDVLVRRSMSGPYTTVELSLPLLRLSDLTPDVASDVLLSA